MNKLWAQVLVSMTIVVPFWGVVYMVAIFGLRIEPDVKLLIKDLMMQVLPIVTGIVGYWVGSSHNSATKDQVIAEMAKGDTAK